MTKAHINSISITSYSSDLSHATGYIGLSGNKISTSIQLDKEDVEQLAAVAYAILERRKLGFADAIASIETPALLGYDSEQTIEHRSENQPSATTVYGEDEIPF